MHDADSFERMPAVDSIAEQSPMEEMLSSFEKECEVLFKEEVYLVRDNGAVFRRACPQARRRKHDEVWTFGTLDRHKGYMKIGEHVVHQIVASAFHGLRPSTDHVVDHIDTNRQNNRPDNLRWVTRLENILINPITRARIERAFGSLEAFFENPSASYVPNWDWMRIVTKEQAQESRRRLLEWAEKGQAGGGGSLGDWLYKPKPQAASAASEGIGRRSGAASVYVLDAPSLTARAVQRKWRTPTEFPQCPLTVSKEALNGYLARLAPGAVFARNRYGESSVVEAGIAPDNTLSVVCNTQSGLKDWTHAKVYVEGEIFCHESGGTFFTREGAMKAHCMAIGEPFDAYEGSIDDYC